MLNALSLKQFQPSFSLNPDLIHDIFKHAQPLGHYEDAKTANLGFGFMYYSMVRALKPRHVVVIGSGFGFSVACLALGLKDNQEGQLSFVDPSYSLVSNGPFQTIGGTSQWSNPDKTREHFRRFGVDKIVTHHKLTSEQFFKDYADRGLPPIDIGFIDGNHSFEAVRHDFIAMLQHTHKNSYLMLHDTNIYIRELVRHAGVKRFLKRISPRHQDFEVIDFPFASGVAMVRVMHNGPWVELDA